MSQSQVPSEELPFHLKGNFAPIKEEFTEFDLEVTGAIPPELRGRFFRNGANPKTGWSPHWFLGNGMIHGLALEGGKAHWYRNRYVQTPLLGDPEMPRFAEDGTADHTASCANTHVIRHAGRILALEEGAFPFEITPELETVGPHDFGGKLKTAMTAHPRICPETGELLFFGYGPMPPYLTYHRVSASGELVQSEEIDVKGPTMMHDWNVTRNFVVFMDLPVVFDLAALAEGGLPIKWSDDYGARLGVMPREGSNADVKWYEIDPCYVFHPMNSYEEEGRIIIDVCRMERMEMAGGDDSPPMLHRWTIDPQKGSVTQDQLDDRASEFPRVQDAVVGRKNRYGYTIGMGSSAPDSMGVSFMKYDLANGSREVHEFAGGVTVGEPVFATAPDATAEDDGWLLSFSYDPARDKSDLVILDAKNLSAEPVAKVHLPTRVPFGFHGSWIADSD